MTCILFPLVYCSIVKCNKNTISAELLIHVQGKVKYSNCTNKMSEKLISLIVILIYSLTSVLSKTSKLDLQLALRSEQG